MELTHRIIENAQRLHIDSRSHESIFMLNQLAVETMNQLANTHCDLWHEREAIKCMEMTVALDPKNWALQANLAHVYNMFNFFELAKQASQRSIALSLRQQPAPFFNYGVILANLLEWEECINTYKTYLTLCPENHMAHYNYGCALLTNRQLSEGWPEYEHRMKAFDVVRNFRNRFSQPEWKGDDLTGKVICVYSEQGVGDFIHFSRFLSKIKEKNPKKIIVEVQDKIRNLFAYNFPDITFVGRNDGPDYGKGPDCDVVISICSLCYIFDVKLEDISGKSYLIKDKVKTPKIKSNKLKIGFSWAGNHKHSQDSLRNVPLKYFKKIGLIPNVELYSLQVKNDDGDKLRMWRNQWENLQMDCGGMKFIDMHSYLKTFSETAACIDKMDLIITVDTALAHLAGAMGKETWLLLPHVVDWRWFKDGNTTPWYDSVRMFRQTKFRVWDDVFDNVIEALQLR